MLFLPGTRSPASDAHLAPWSRNLPVQSERTLLSRDIRSAFDYCTTARRRLENAQIASSQKPTYLPLGFPHIPTGLVHSPDINNNSTISPKENGFHVPSNIHSDMCYFTGPFPSLPLSPYSPQSPSLLGNCFYGYCDKSPLNNFNVWNSFLKTDLTCLYKSRLSPTSLFHPYKASKDRIMEDLKMGYPKGFDDLEKPIRTDISPSQTNELPKSQSSVSVSIVQLRCCSMV